MQQRTKANKISKSGGTQRLAEVGTTKHMLRSLLEQC
jgi:hypothetical protein